MSAQTKPLRMADLPGRVYICPDEHLAFKSRERDPNSTSEKLRRLEIGEECTIPVSSSGLISRISKANNKVFSTKRMDGNMTVKRVK